MAPEGHLFLEVMEVQEDTGNPCAVQPAAIGWTGKFTYKAIKSRVPLGLHKLL